MEPKKSEKANVYKNSGIYRDLGIVAALLIIIMAFTYEEKTNVEFTLQSNIALDEEEEIADITQEERKPPPPPPPPQIEVVEDDEVIEEEQPEFEEVDVPEDFEVEIPDVEPEKEVVAEPVFSVVEDMPEFPGGQAEMMKYIMSRIVYPELEKQNNIEGLAIIQFIVEPNGQISNVTTAPGAESRASQSLREEAIRVIKTMPAWKPGKQRGKPVKVKFTIPVRFKLR